MGIGVANLARVLDVQRVELKARLDELLVGKLQKIGLTILILQYKVDFDTDVDFKAGIVEVAKTIFKAIIQRELFGF